MDLNELLPMIFEFLKKQNFDFGNMQNLLSPPNNQTMQTPNFSDSAFQLPNYMPQTQSANSVQTQNDFGFSKQKTQTQFPNYAGQTFEKQNSMPQAQNGLSFLNNLSPQMIETIASVLSNLLKNNQTKKEDEPSFFSNLTRCDD